MDNRKLGLTPYLKGLLKKPPVFSANDISICLEMIMGGEIVEPQISALLTALRITELDRDAEIIASAAKTMLQFSMRIPSSQINPSLLMSDIVGTGGDGKNTFNASTTAAIIAAGSGIPICKHGNKASTSSSGSADLLKCLGAKLDSIIPSTILNILSSFENDSVTPFLFLYAPIFHPMMAKVVPIRKSLGIPTIFNILGPLINPYPCRYRMVGVYAKELGPIFARAFILLAKDLGCTISGWIVWGEEGLDEISPEGPTRIWEFSSLKGEDQIKEFVLTPTDFGLSPHKLSDVASKSPQENAQYAKKLFANQIPDGDPIKDFVLMNAAALAYITGHVKSLKEGINFVSQSLKSRSAEKTCQKFAHLTELAEKELNPL